MSNEEISIFLDEFANRDHAVTMMGGEEEEEGEEGEQEEEEEEEDLEHLNDVEDAAPRKTKKSISRIYNETITAATKLNPIGKRHRKKKKFDDE